MSKETIQYQAGLIRQSTEILKNVLRELEQGKELSMHMQENIILVFKSA